MSSVGAACGLVLALLFTIQSAVPPTPGDYWVYVGTYTRDRSKGIYAYRLDTRSGKLQPVGLVAETANPSFLALHPNGRFLYAVNEISEFEGKAAGSVSAYAIDAPNGGLRLLNRVSSGGGGPCYVTVDPSGRNALVANYGGGSVAVLPLRDDGLLGETSAFVQHSGSSVNERRQQAPHAHSVQISHDGRFALAADLGLDKILVYRFDPSKGSLSPNDPPSASLKPGSGPRHFSFHPGGKYSYAINELQSTVTAFAWDAASGILSELQTLSTLPEGHAGNNSTAEVLVHPSGRFVYGSNRGHNSIAVFAVDPQKGVLTPVEHVSTQGRTPRNFGVDPEGKFLIAANQASDSLIVFRIDADTGRLTPTGSVVEAYTPVCVKFLASR